MKNYNILFLCTHNSARSILAEATATVYSLGRLVGYSAGSHPSNTVNPIAAELAIEMGYPSDKLRSKDWSEFTRPNAPQMDFVITVCDQAADESCPVWLGQPILAHWGFVDPSRLEGDNVFKRKAFLDLTNRLRKSIEDLCALPLDVMDRGVLQKKLTDIHGS